MPLTVSSRRVKPAALGRISSKSPETESRSIFLGCSVSSRAQFPEVVSREISRAAPEQVIFAEMVERLSWLECQIDYANAEFGKYNNSAAMFQAEYDAFANWYNRTHKPKGTRIRYF